jgi:hypothetical protein
MSAGTLHPLKLRTQGRRRTLAPTPPIKHWPAYQPVERRVSICPLYLSRYPEIRTPRCPRSAGCPFSRQFPFPRHEHTLSKGNTCLRNRMCDTARRHRRRCRRRRCGPRSYASCHLSPVAPTPKSVSQSQPGPPVVPCLNPDSFSPRLGLTSAPFRKRISNFLSSNRGEVITA